MCESEEQLKLKCFEQTNYLFCLKHTQSVFKTTEFTLLSQ